MLLPDGEQACHSILIVFVMKMPQLKGSISIDAVLNKDRINMNWISRERDARHIVVYLEGIALCVFFKWYLYVTKTSGQTPRLANNLTKSDLKTILQSHTELRCKDQ